MDIGHGKWDMDQRIRYKGYGVEDRRSGIRDRG